jgi:hypothetical protein
LTLLLLNQLAHRRSYLIGKQDRIQTPLGLDFIEESTVSTVKSANNFRGFLRRHDRTQVLFQPVGEQDVALSALLSSDGLNGRPEHLLIALRASAHKIDD